MSRIIINGAPLHTLSAEQIVIATSNPKYDRQSDGIATDYYRNRNLLAAFESDEMLGAASLAQRFYTTGRDRTWSVQFYALRAGEALQWATEHGIVERVKGRGHRWRLLRRELQFERVGPAGKQRAIQIRGLAGPEAVIAAKLWKREQGRRERARVKEVTRLRSFALEYLDRIRRHAAGWPMPLELDRFCIGGVTTFEGARDLILDEFGSDMSCEDGMRLNRVLCREAVLAHQAFRDGRATPPPPVHHPLVPSEDLAELGEMFL